MRYHFLEDVAIADIAFEAEGQTLPDLFENSALALTHTMVKDLRSIEKKAAKNIELEAKDPEMLLYRFLQELVYHKDARALLFSDYSLEITEHSGKWLLRGDILGEEMDQHRHQLVADVKAVSLHNFKVEKTARGWRAEVILDV